MAKTELQDRNSARIDSAKIDEFAATLAGRLIRPADPDYDAARRIWNAAIDKHPGLIVALPRRGRCCSGGEVRGCEQSPCRRARRRPQRRRPRAVRQRSGDRPLGHARRDRRSRHAHGTGSGWRDTRRPRPRDPPARACRANGRDFQDRRRRADAWRRRRLAGAQAWAELRQRHLVRVGDGRRQGADGQRRRTP